ncbi:MAG: branched-subunit amino acid transport protein [Hyphomicrobiaceae bacterium]|jgi:branched-subunit amino acid transport protein
MSPIGNDVSGYLIVLAFALIAHESWRWLGAFLGAQVRETDAVFVWVRYVSTALVSALAMRIILFPSGALSSVDLPYRVAALAISTIAFLLFKRSLAAGIIIGSASLIAMGLAFGAS